MERGDSSGDWERDVGGGRHRHALSPKKIKMITLCRSRKSFRIEEECDKKLFFCLFSAAPSEKYDRFRRSLSRQLTFWDERRRQACRSRRPPPYL